jgi:lipid-A-disaccharide synthase
MGAPVTNGQRSILLSAGEVSGDAVAARLALALTSREPDLVLWGLGGPKMAAAGVDLAAVTSHLGAVGVSEPLAAIPALWRAFATLRHRVRRAPPAVAVVIGNDVFNVVLARWLRRQGVPVACFFPPQVWLWQALARPIAKSYDEILACFPEEPAVYGGHGVPTRFVGHYLADLLQPVGSGGRAVARAGLGLAAARETAAEGQLVALLPGSRGHEVSRHLPVLLGAARRLLTSAPGLRFVLPLAESRFFEPVAAAVSAHGLGRAVSVVDTEAAGQRALRAADLALVASGTATLEATLLGVPMVVLYKVSPLTLAVVRFCHRLGLIADMTVALPNLILATAESAPGGSERAVRAVPELGQEDATAERLAAVAGRLLADPEARAAQRADLARAAARLRAPPALPGAIEPGTWPQDAIARAATAVLALAGRRDSAAPQSPAAPPPARRSSPNRETGPLEVVVDDGVHAR